MHSVDIVSVQYGFWSPPRIRRAHYFHFKNRNGNVFAVAFNSHVYSSEVGEKWYAAIEAKIMEVFGNARITAIHQQLIAGQDIKFEVCTATRNGLQFSRRRWFKTTTHLVPWEKIGFGESATECSVILGDLKDKDARFEFRYGAEWDGQFMIKYIQMLKKSPKMLQELKR